MAKQCTMDAIELSFVIFDFICDSCLLCTGSFRNRSKEVNTSF